MFYDEEGMFFLSALLPMRISCISAYPTLPPPPPPLLLHAKKSSPYLTD